MAEGQWSGHEFVMLSDDYTTVNTALDELPRAYTPELYQQKCDSVYQQVYDSYQGEGRNIYAPTIN